MKYGSFTYNENEYLFTIDNGKMKVANKNGIDVIKMFLSWNKKATFVKSLQYLEVRFFPLANKGIIFHQDSLEFIDGGEFIDIIGYIEFENEKEEINGASIEFEELNYYLDTNKSISNIDYSEDGINIALSKSIKTSKKSFKVKNKKIEYWYELNNQYNNKSKDIFSLATTINFDFGDKVDDYSLLTDVYNINHIYFSYISQRQNIVDNIITLLSIKKDNITKVGKFVFNKKKDININMNISPEEIEEHIIRYDNIEPIESKMFESIAKHELFLRHIPRNQVERNQISDGRFLSHTSGFEWEFDQMYPNGIHKESTINKSIKLSKKLDTLEFDSWEKGIIRNTKKHMLDISLEAKMNKVYEDLHTFSVPILNQILSLNEVNDKKSIFKEVNELRNNFAHGEIKIDYGSDGILGIIYLERMIYVMQLKRLGLDDENIKKCINSLFTIIF